MTFLSVSMYEDLIVQLKMWNIGPPTQKKTENYNPNIYKYVCM